MTSELHKVQRPMKDLVKWTAILSLNLNSLLDKRLETFGINSSQFVYILKVCRNPGITRECIFHEIYRKRVYDEGAKSGRPENLSFISD